MHVVYKKILVYFRNLITKWLVFPRFYNQVIKVTTNQKLRFLARIFRIREIQQGSSVTGNLLNSKIFFRSKAKVVALAFHIAFPYSFNHTPGLGDKISAVFSFQSKSLKISGSYQLGVLTRGRHWDRDRHLKTGIPVFYEISFILCEGRFFFEKKANFTAI